MESSKDPGELSGIEPGEPVESRDFDASTIQSDTSDPDRFIHPTHSSWSAAFEVERRFHSGPLPPPDTLRELDAIFPGAAKVIFAEFQAQGKHRREMEKQLIGLHSRTTAAGQWFGFLIGMTGLIGSIVVTGMGHGVWGSVIAGSTLLSLVSVFVIGRRDELKEGKDQDQLGDQPEAVEDVGRIEGNQPGIVG